MDLRPRAWLLNLDADDELAPGGRATPTPATRARLAGFVPWLRASGLVLPGDALLGDGLDARALARPEARGLPGLAWSPTPRALRALARAGASAPAHAPPRAVLARVTARRFIAEAPCFARHAPAGTALCADEPALDAALDALLAREQPLVLKRMYGFAGRGRLLLASAAERALPATRAWLAASLREGPLLCEPWLRRTDDFALHGYVAPGGARHLGAPTRQRTDPRGVWLDTARCAEGELAPHERAALYDAAEACAEALAHAGYAGPFGLDAFRYEPRPGAPPVLRALCELNARYTMGWAVGMGALRPDREAP